MTDLRMIFRNMVIFVVPFKAKLWKDIAIDVPMIHTNLEGNCIKGDYSEKKSINSTINMNRIIK